MNQKTKTGTFELKVKSLNETSWKFVKRVFAAPRCAFRNQNGAYSFRLAQVTKLLFSLKNNSKYEKSFIFHMNWCWWWCVRDKQK